MYVRAPPIEREAGVMFLHQDVDHVR